MNRAVHLHRPPPTAEDLALTARGILGREDTASSADETSGDVLPERLLHGLAHAYTKVYRDQQLQDFWGLREFYSLVRAVKQR